MIMQAVGVAEDNIFKKRKEDEVSLNAVLTLRFEGEMSVICVALRKTDIFKFIWFSTWVCLLGHGHLSTLLCWSSSKSVCKDVKLCGHIATRGRYICSHHILFFSFLNHCS